MTITVERLARTVERVKPWVAVVMSVSAAVVDSVPADEERTEVVEQPAGALCPAFDTVEAVEVDALFGVGQARSLALRLHHDRRQGGGDMPVVEPHVVGEDDSLLVYDVGVG